MEPVLLDESFSDRGGRYKLVRIYGLSDGHKIRIKVNRDFYFRQSYAEAEMLTSERGFLPVLAAPAGEWFDGTPAATSNQDDRRKPALEAISDGLLKRVLNTFSAGS